MPSPTRNDKSEVESHLVALAQAGDRDAYCALAQEQVAGLLRAAAAFGCDRGAAEDLAQETLLEAWRSIGRFDGRCRLGTWLFGILRNRWLKSLRKKQPVSLEQAEAWIRLASETPGPVALLEKAEESVRLRQAVAGLPESQRVVVEMRFFAHSSLEEIAAALGCPLGTVKSRLHHGLLNLSGKENLNKDKFE